MHIESTFEKYRKTDTQRLSMSIDCENITRKLQNSFSKLNGKSVRRCIFLFKQIGRICDVVILLIGNYSSNEVFPGGSNKRRN